MIFFKLTLDILTHYYRTVEAPLFRKLQTEIIPLAIAFYSWHTNHSLFCIVTEFTDCMNDKSKEVIME